MKHQKLESHEGGVAHEGVDGRRCGPTHYYSLNIECALLSDHELQIWSLE